MHPQDTGRIRIQDFGVDNGLNPLKTLTHNHGFNRIAAQILLKKITRLINKLETSYPSQIKTKLLRSPMGPFCSRASVLCNFSCGSNGVSMGQILVPGASSMLERAMGR